MQRRTAKLLVLVLVAGICAPFAAAGTMQAAGAHCIRKPLQAARVDDAPSCHRHHGALPADPAVTKESSSRQSIHSNQCCNDHECCRSTVRSLWAQPRLKADVRVVAQAETTLPTYPFHIHGSELVAHYAARAPPAL